MWGNLVQGRAGQLGLKGRSGQALEFTGPAEMWINVTNLPGGKAGPSGPREPGRPVIGPWCVCPCYPTQPGSSHIDWQLPHSWAPIILLSDLSAGGFPGIPTAEWDLPAPSRETALSEASLRDLGSPTVISAPTPLPAPPLRCTEEQTEGGLLEQGETWNGCLS